ncbi:ParA family protein [Campylobacter sp. TTU-622]|uniref:ParA family protein n=1 Tax=Campylobacter sp. TTU-622 TaxID=2800583 RepID=UPI00181E303D|nr:ParA family protein [Campylobacter sp. TTU-622]EAI8568771.1 ParA family protein [Campylobacter jejuni]EFS0701722.1 ParA family protein [Campylobacter jejuni]EHS1057282.1 ParA family protein [Campylobacter jejuni]EHS1059167.1 ParA family protein [Campylobacter jejuni]EHS1060918.1 ParA family protein [Campylobacter jejuni]
MKILSVCNEKGGCGKTTILANLAIALYQEGSKNLVIDADPQKSLGTFVSIRNQEGHFKKFDYIIKQGEAYFDCLLNLKQNNKENYKYILSDTGGRDSKEMRFALALSDIVIIPVIPSQYDVSVFDRVIEVVKMAKVKNPNLQVFILINLASTNPFLSKKIDELREYIKSVEQDYIKLLDFVIFQREKYKIFTQMGLGVTEDEKKDKAYLEINNLCEFIKKIK